MGIFKDTYIVNKIDTKRIEYELNRKNELLKEKNEIEKTTKNRVDISLNEYEKLKEENKNQKQLIEEYQKFITDLGKKIHIAPDALLKYKLIENDLSENILHQTYNLHLIFEINKSDLIVEEVKE